MFLEEPPYNFGEIKTLDLVRHFSLYIMNVGSGVQGESSIWQDLTLVKRFEFKFYLQFYSLHNKYYFSTLLPVILKLFIMGHMDEKQALFEQLTLSDFKKWSSAVWKIFIIPP